MSKKKYIRICSKCKRELKYSCYQSWYRSEKNKSFCKECSCSKRKNGESSLTLLVKAQYDLGLSNRAIAKKLDCHHNTVKYHLKKMGLKSNWDKNQPIKMVSENMAQCSKCGTIKPLGIFSYGRKGQNYEYRFSYCKDCRKEQAYLNLNSNIERFLGDRFNRLKRRCKIEKIKCNITKSDIIEMFKLQKGECFYTDEKLNWGVGKGLDYRRSLSIDKVIPEKGYLKGNVVLCTMRANSSKTNWSMIELEKWMPEWHKRIKDFIKNK